MHTQRLNVFFMRFLFFEALICLLLARGALRYIPFKRIEWFMNLPTKHPELQGEARRLLRNAVRRSILRATQLLPGETVCFPRGLVAQMMLRRRHVSTILYYGALTEDGKGLMTHVWVQDGSLGVIGLRAANGYKVIARYPEN